MDVDLQTAVTTWCDPRRVKILRDGGDATWAVIPPLLVLLRAGVGANATVRERSGGGGGSPIDADAWDILDRVRVTAADWTLICGLPRRVGLAPSLRQLAGHTWPDPRQGAQLARILGHLAARAAEHLSPPDVAATRYVRDWSCPHCGERTAAGVNGYGEPGRVPVLVVVLNRGLVRYVWCQACGHQWPRDQLEGWAWDATAADRGVPA